MISADNPRGNVTEVARAMRSLVHSAQFFESPADSYEVVGDLLSSVASLQQVFLQVARVHRHGQLSVRDDAGNARVGRTSAMEATDRLQQAAGLLELVEHRIDQASQQSGRIVWPANEASRPATPVVTAEVVRAVAPISGLESGSPRPAPPAVLESGL